MGAEFTYEDLKARLETALIMSGTGKSELLCQECYRASDWSFQEDAGNVFPGSTCDFCLT